MKIQVTVNNVIIQEKNILNENEYNVHECEFEFTEEYNGLTKKAVFTGLDGKTYVQTIIDDKCNIPNEILQKRQTVKLGVYGYDVDNEELMLRYSPRPTEFTIHEGSYKEGENTTPPTPSEVEQLQAQITSNKNDIEEIQGDVVDINQDIVDIKAEQITQNGNIQTNADNISTINGQIVSINADIDNLEETKADKTEIPTKTSELINDSDFVSDRNYVHTDNNFTDTYKNQINQNTSDISSLNTNKADKTEIPTKTSQLTNDSGFITKNVNDLANYYKKSETYNKTEIDGKVSSVYKYKGTVATYQDLPSTDLIIGDVYNVEEDGSNYAWTGNSWDKLGGDIDLSEYYTKTQTDSLLSAKANSNEVYTKTETYGKAEVNTLLNGKVDKVEGKGLSTEDFTTAEKQKLASLENYDDTEVKADISELQESQTTQDSEIETLQQENEQLKQDVEDLRNNSLTVEGTGTDITLQNTAKARLLKNELSGRTEQEQLQGINLIPMNRPSFTVSGVTFTNNENSFILNGTKGAYFGERLTTNFSRVLKANTDYTLVFEVINGSVTDIPSISNITVATPTDVNYKYMSISTLTSKGQKKIMKFVPTEDTVIRGFYIYFGVGNAVFNNYEIRVWLVEGNYTTETMPAYEAYCGGIPSPNPDFPQQIKNVTGNANIKIQNKNLALPTWASNFVTNVNNSINASIRIKDGKECLTYIASAGYGDYENCNFNKGINFKENTQYTISFSGIKTEGSNKAIFTIEYTDGSKTEMSDYSNLNVWENKTITSAVNKTVKYIRPVFNSGRVYIDLATFQIEQSTTATDFVEHQEQNLPFTFESGQFLADDENLKDNGMNKKWKQVTFSGTSITLEDAKTNGAYFCNKKVSGNLVDKTLTFDEGVVDAIIQYELETEEIIPYNETQQEQYNNIQKARSYDDITYITSESDELGFNMDVESLRNIKSTIEDLGTRLKALEN